RVARDTESGYTSRFSVSPRGPTPPAAETPGAPHAMIESLKDDKVINQLGGRFKFTALVQHRIRELMEGARPLVERQGRNDFEVAVQEIVEGKITLEMTEDGDDEQVADD